MSVFQTHATATADWCHACGARAARLVDMWLPHPGRKGGAEHAGPDEHGRTFASPGTLYVRFCAGCCAELARIATAEHPARVAIGPPTRARAVETPRALDGPSAAALRALLEAAGIDTTTGRGDLRPADALRAFETLRGTAHASELARVRLASFARPPTRPIAWLSRVLGRLGLKLETLRKEGPRNNRAWIYGIVRSGSDADIRAAWSPGATITPKAYTGPPESVSKFRRAETALSETNLD